MQGLILSFKLPYVRYVAQIGMGHFLYGMDIHTILEMYEVAELSLQKIEYLSKQSLEDLKNSYS